jgi:transcriptional regulator with XRE-family HTH domain
MSISLQDLGNYVKAAREDIEQTQDQLVTLLGTKVKVNRSQIAHLEQGRRVPSAEVLELICKELHIPRKFWEPFTEDDYLQRLDFESSLTELAGYRVTLQFLDSYASVVANKTVTGLFTTVKNASQALDTLNSVLVFYRVPPMTMDFFLLYFGVEAMRSCQDFEKGVQKFQQEAIRLFSTFQEAYLSMNYPGKLEVIRRPLLPRDVSSYHNREPWCEIEQVEEKRLSDLGYISAQKARSEEKEREAVTTFLRELGNKVAQSGKSAIDTYTEKTRRKMSSLLRKFDSRLPHDFMSPLFVPDADELLREADVLAPKGNKDLDRIESTQSLAQRNLARYLAADHLDIYVATSMRVDADFVSVNRFAKELFNHPNLRLLNLRFFNPTQSWIDDRVAKGLVEALMLRRAALTIYMAQKSDTFGKDSEASVALGQGKPVVVFVPKLLISSESIDSEEIGNLSRKNLEQEIQTNGNEDDQEIDPTMDHDSLVARLLTLRLHKLDRMRFANIIRAHWADFDLYSEAHRIDDEKLRECYRVFLDDVISGKPDKVLPQDLLEPMVGILVAVAVRFEGRARLFRDVHPLALQVIASTGVLNGILVARSVDVCAKLIESLMKNELEFELHREALNYRLVEKITSSTARVISRHPLITNAFATYYSRSPQCLND